MRLSIAILCLCFVAGAAEIPAGAHVALQLVNAVDTRTAQVGDYVYLRTASPIAAAARFWFRWAATCKPPYRARNAAAV